VIISFHEVELTKKFASRIIASKFGQKIYGGHPNGGEFDAGYTSQQTIEGGEIRERRDQGAG